LVLKLKSVKAIVLRILRTLRRIYDRRTGRWSAVFNDYTAHASAMIISGTVPGLSPEFDKKGSEGVPEVMASTIPLVATMADVIAHL
jgi:hypothetical protein